MSSENKRRQGPPPGRGMNPGEKPKNFANAIIRLTSSLGRFKISIVIALLLAGLSAVLKGLNIFSNNVTAIVSVIGKNNKFTGGTIDITGIKKAMISLAEKENELSTFMNYKNIDGELSRKKCRRYFLAHFE